MNAYTTCTLSWFMYHYRKKHGKKCLTQRMWMTTSKVCLWGTSGELNMWTHSACSNMYKTCASPRQRKSWHGDRVGSIILPKSMELVSVAGKGRIVFSNIVASENLTTLQWMTTHPQIFRKHKLILKGIKSKRQKVEQEGDEGGSVKSWARGVNEIKTCCMKLKELKIEKNLKITKMSLSWCWKEYCFTF